MVAKPERGSEDRDDRNEEPRWQQLIYDDIVLILMLGLVIPTIFYIVLGLMDLASVPTFQP